MEIKFLLLCSIAITTMDYSFGEASGKMSIRVLKRPVWYPAKDNGELQLKRIVRKDHQLGQIREEKRVFPISVVLSDNDEHLFRMYKLPVRTF